MITYRQLHLIARVSIGLLALSALSACNNAYELRHGSLAEQQGAPYAQTTAQPVAQDQTPAIYQTPALPILAMSESASAARNITNQDIMQGQAVPLLEPGQSDSRPAAAQATSHPPQSRVVQDYAARYR